MDDDVGLSLCINEAIVRSIQIDAPSVHVLPYHPKLKTIQLGMLWVELAALEMFDDLQGIQEVLHLGWQRVWRPGSLSEFPQPLEITGFTIVCNKNSNFILVDC